MQQASGNYFDIAATHKTMEGLKSMKIAHRMVKKTVQQGRSERRGEAYCVPYVEPLNEARTKRADFFNILLGTR
ncbi:MAG TPA: hypothetical protein DEA71_10320 [Nitrospira sp.]|nr:hypothetical protein [Nitrospira sp.]